MTVDRAMKQQARDLAAILDTSYTHALTLLRVAREQDPTLRGVALRERCRALMALED